MTGMNNLDSKTPHFHWFSHVLPIFFALVALVMVVVTPVWAVPITGAVPGDFA